MRNEIKAIQLACMLVLGNLMILLGSGSLGTTAGSWNVETVDSMGNVGKHTSLALDDEGHAHIGYYDETSGDLKLAEWTGSKWHIDVVDSTGDVGDYASIALDNDDRAHLSYYDGTNRVLKYATYTGARWHVETVDWLVPNGWWTSIALDSGDNPHISYLGNSLKYARWNGSSWDIQTVDSSGGSFTSMALDCHDYPHISYYDAPNEDLKYARWNGSSWSVETVDWEGPIGSWTGSWTSIALDSKDFPHITYYSLAQLKYARRTEGGWSVEIVRSVEFAPTYSSIALDGHDYPHISYYSSFLFYVKWNGSNWVGEVVDSSGFVGWYTSIALDSSGYVHISYYDLTNSDLKYAKGRMNFAPNTPSTPLGPTSGNQHVWYTYQTSATDPDGDNVKYSLDWGDGSMSFTPYVASGVSAGEPHNWGDPGTYYVRAMATDLSGASSGWSSPLEVVIAGLPREPGNLTASPNNGQVTLTWRVPASDGGSPITSYWVYRATVSGGETFLVEIGNVLTYLDTGLTNGVTYYYLVAAVNAVGKGPNSTEAPATPATTPSEPLSLQVTAGNSQVALSWTAPASSGGFSITNYNIYRGRAPNAENFLVEIGNILTYVDTNLTNGLTYYYLVAAVNALGQGPNSTEAHATPGTMPSEPLNLRTKAGNNLVTITWTAPTFNGGFAITRYVVYRGLAAGAETFLVEVGNVTTYVDAGVVNGQTYYYKVTAKNAVGESQRSTEAYATPATIPGPPMALTAVAGNGQVTLTWTAPTDSGGSPITNYAVYRGTVPSDRTFLIEIGNVLTHTDSGLTNGVTYYYTVAAVNDIGHGPNSTEANATPATMPSEPLGLQATAGDGRVTLTWIAPASGGGSPITDYTIYRGTASGGEALLVEVGNVLSYVDAGLTNGRTYFYKVSAVNAAGEGPKSNEVSATPVAPSPTNLPPTCNIVSPVPGSTVAGTYRIAGIASDVDGTVRKVEVRIDNGEWIETSGNTSWTYDWDTTTVPNGQHTIYARSNDGANYSAEVNVTVTVRSAPPPPPQEASVYQAAFWALLAVVIVETILLLFLLLMGTKGKEPQEEQFPEPVGEESAEQDEDAPDT